MYCFEGRGTVKMPCRWAGSFNRRLANIQGNFLFHAELFCVVSPVAVWAAGVCASVRRSHSGYWVMSHGWNVKEAQDGWVRVVHRRRGSFCVQLNLKTGERICLLTDAPHKLCLVTEGCFQKEQLHRLKAFNRSKLHVQRTQRTFDTSLCFRKSLGALFFLLYFFFYRRSHISSLYHLFWVQWLNSCIL